MEGAQCALRSCSCALRYYALIRTLMRVWRDSYVSEPSCCTTSIRDNAILRIMRVKSMRCGECDVKTSSCSVGLDTCGGAHALRVSRVNARVREETHHALMEGTVCTLIKDSSRCAQGSCAIRAHLRVNARSGDSCAISEDLMHDIRRLINAFTCKRLMHV
jgi:hypothetical protein